MERLIKALDATADGAFIINADQVITYWNQAAEQILGFKSNQVIDWRCYRIIGGRDKQEQRICQERCWVALAAFSGAPVRNFDMRVRTKAGEKRLLNISIMTLPNSDGEGGPFVLHLFRDITYKEQNQAKLRHILTMVEELHQKSQNPINDAPDAGELVKKLTKREREVLLLLTQGHSTEEIASALFISPTTVRNYVQKILDKLQVHSRLEAVVYAYRQGIADDGT